MTTQAKTPTTAELLDDINRIARPDINEVAPDQRSHAERRADERDRKLADETDDREAVNELLRAMGL